MVKPLEQLLADERSDASVLRHRGYAHDADIIDRLCDAVAKSAEDWITFVGETEAKLQSGKSVDWFKTRFPEWERQGLARWNPNGRRERQFRRCIVPRRAQIDATIHDAERAADEEVSRAS